MRNFEFCCCQKLSKVSVGKNFSYLLLPKIENKLNELKTHLFDDIVNHIPDGEKNYCSITNIMDLGIYLKQNLRKHRIKGLTNAFLKMKEIMSIIELPQNPKSFHIAEAPGAFIMALTHTHKECDWFAQSLSPKIDKALGDSFGLIKDYPNRWIIEKDGDMTDPETILLTYEKLKTFGEIDLITSDAKLSVDNYDCIKRKKVILVNNKRPSKDFVKECKKIAVKLSSCQKLSLRSIIKYLITGTFPVKPNQSEINKWIEIYL